MEPILWRNIALQTTAAKDVLSDEGNKSCMFRIVIQRIAEADTLEDKPCGLTDHLAKARLAPAVSLIIEGGHVLAECVGEHRGRSKHVAPVHLEGPQFRSSAA